MLHDTKIDAEFNQELNAVIEKNMTKMVGEQLRQRLDLLPKLEVEITNNKARLVENNQTITRLTKTIEDYKSYDSIIANLEEREKAVSKRENDSEIFELKAQLNCEKEKSKFGFDIGLGLVRNTEFRKSAFGGDMHSFTKDYQGNVISESNSNNKTETETTS